MATVYLSLGTNLGNRELNLNEAVTMIKERIGSISSVSALCQTSPWGFESPNEFLNLVLICETPLSPQMLLSATQQIEIEQGRTQKSHGKYSDRLIDIDILYYDDIVLETPNLTIPHPLLHLREFVLLPLLEIAPQFRHPLFLKTTTEMLAELKKSSIQTPTVEK